MGVTETAIDKGIDRGKKQKTIEVAKEALKNKLDFALISTLTQLSIQDIEKLSKGENIEDNDVD